MRSRCSPSKISWANITFTCLWLLVPFTARAAGEVQLTYLGHASFEIVTAIGSRIVIDPYGNSLWSHWFDRPFPPRSTDFVLVTHAHFDHNASTRVLGDFELLNIPGTKSVTGADITAIAGRHARQKLYGAANLVFLMVVDGLRIVHWGDNDADVTPALSQQLGRVDLLILPIDASEHLLTLAEVAFVIGQLNPRIVVPAHYFHPLLTSRCSTLGPIDDWLATRPYVRRIPAHGTRLSLSTLPAKPETWVFEPALAPASTMSRLSILPCPLQTAALQLGLVGYFSVGLVLASVYILLPRSRAGLANVTSLVPRTAFLALAWPIFLARGFHRRPHQGSSP